MAKVNLQKIEQDARYAFSEDGLTYLFLGFLLALVGLSFYDSQFAAFGGLAALLIFPVKALRERITYPRIGYVEFSVPKNFGRGILGFMMGAIAVLVLVAFVANGRFRPIMPVIISISFGLAIYFATSMNGIRLRDWVVIGLMLMSGPLAAYFIESWRTATAVQMWITAVLLILMGTIDLIYFMNKYPVREVYHDTEN